MGLLSSVGKILGKAAPFAAVIPGIGAPLSAGMSFLSGMSGDVSDDLLGAGLDYYSSAHANKQNAAEAQRNRDFQLMMSSTAYQRQAADLKAAGYNPILGAYQGSGASTGGGSQAVMQPRTARLSAHMALASQAATIDNIRASTAKTAAEAKVIEASSPWNTLKGRVTGALERSVGSVDKAIGTIGGTAKKIFNWFPGPKLK